MWSIYWVDLFSKKDWRIFFICYNIYVYISLISKLADQSTQQIKLQSQLAEVSYRAVNGTRQNTRNFAEGAFSIGTKHFKTPPEDKITK
jgi:hypothetical protein